MRRLSLFLLFLLFTLPVLAQETGPDYAIRSLRQPRFTPDNSQVIVEFDVINNGTEATVPSTVRLYTELGEDVARDQIAPLPANGRATVTLTFRADTFPQNSTQSLRIAVGIDEVESADSATAGDNFSRISVLIPELGNITPPAPTEEAPSTDTDAEASPLAAISTWLEGLDLGFTFDAQNPVHLAVAGALSCVLLFIVVVGFVLLRLIFYKKPVFGTYIPPYANMPLVDPHSIMGQRQGWQQHAQNDLMPGPVTQEGATHIRKRLTSYDGVKLGNWQIKGMRLCQYDQYGRVASSQTIAPQGNIKTLNRALKKWADLPAESLTKKLKPTARGLARQFRKKVNQRSAPLPVALDIGFEGGHGEVRILFELYQVKQGYWQQVDHWEPEMTVMGKRIQESFSYSLRGMFPGETLKDFHKRLEQDIAQMLAYLIQNPPSPNAQKTPDSTPAVIQG
jgi:hypothetical protein